MIICAHIQFIRIVIQTFDGMSVDEVGVYKLRLLAAKAKESDC